jgi:hypothetical protein
MSAMPPGFPLAARDRFDQPLAVGDVVRILSVTSCIKGLADDERALLKTVVGKTRAIESIDAHGFLWLCFDVTQAQSDFSLFPGEVSCNLHWSGKAAIEPSR